MRSAISSGISWESNLAQRGLVLFCALIGALLVFSSPALAAGETPSEPKPVSTEAPTLTGMPVEGQTLSCSPGRWENNPSGYAYTWLRNGSPIAGQTASTYVVQSADWGASISCQVTATSGGEYTIEGLQSGSYDVYAQVPEGLNYQHGTTYNANPVEVKAGTSPSGINFEMQPGGEITGRVTEASGGAGIANVAACANNANAGGCGLTNGSGDYTIAGLPNGSYKVEFDPYERRNYLRQSDGGVSVTVGSTTSGINAALPTGGQIDGRVTKAGGAGVENIKACATSGEGWCGTTNANGEYTISALPSGSYKVEFFRDAEGGDYLPQYYEGESSSYEAEAVPVVAGASPTSGINAEMQPGGEITGKVTAASDGSALANIEACVELSPPFAPVGEFRCATTNDRGEYTIMALWASSYAVEFHADHGVGNFESEPYTANPVEVTVPNTTSGINVEMQHGGQITGKVTAASGGTPLANINVCIGEPPPFNVSGCSISNSDGEYTISGLSSGTYEVSFYPYHDGYVPQTDKSISVIAGSVTSEINAAIPSGGHISGVVTASPGGAPLANIEVCAEDTTSTPYGPYGRNSCATTNNGGSASATSKVMPVPVPNSSFSKAKAPTFDAKAGDLDFYFMVAESGTLSWRLSFKDPAPPFADGSSALDDSAFATEAAKKSIMRCKLSLVRHEPRCTEMMSPFASGLKKVSAGMVEIEVKADAKALKALKAGFKLRVSGPFTFQSALEGSSVTHTESAVVRLPSKRKNG